MAGTVPAASATCDVTVVGGGPAGAAAALALRRMNPSLDVALVEASDYEDMRIGETLPPNARPYLERLGVFERFAREGHLQSYGSASAWGSEVFTDNSFLTSRDGNGWHLDRRRFDAFLAAEASDQGVRTLTGKRLMDSQETQDGWVLELRGQGNALRLVTRYVVDATGRGARFATRRRARRVYFDRLVGVFLFFRPGKRPVPADTRALVESSETGWWYSARLPGKDLVAAFMTDSDLVRGAGLGERDGWLDLLATSSRHTRARIEGLEPCGEPTVYAASSGHLDVLGGNRWLAIGDAASTFDPLSGQGIVKALEHGLWAASAVSEALAGRPLALERFGRRVAGEIEGYLETRDFYYRQERRWPDATFWRRRRPRVALDPHQRLVRAAEPGMRRGKLPMHLPIPDLARLADLCETPRAAHEVVRGFKSGDKSGLSDRRIVLALQYLAEEGVLVPAAAG